MRFVVLAVVAVLAGCTEVGPSGPSATTTSTQEPAPELHWVYVNRTLSISGTNAGGYAQGFQALPGNVNCAYFKRVNEAGLTTLSVHAEGENPDTVQAWDIIADDGGSIRFVRATGLLPLTLNLTDIEPRESDMNIWLETARSSPGSTAVQSPASLSIRLGVTNPDALYVADSNWSCST